MTSKKFVTFKKVFIFSLTAVILFGCGSTERKRLEAQQAQEQRASRMAQKAEVERLNREKELERQAYRKEAGTRNAERIKSIGFPASFTNATIHANVFGRWSEFMPSTQWVGLLLENKKISSIEAITYRNNPGVFIKRQGRPGLALIFRIEGKEAYPYAASANNETTLIKTDGDHFAITTTMGQLTSEASMN